jgi:hypothetical protein
MNWRFQDPRWMGRNLEWRGPGLACIDLCPSSVAPPHRPGLSLSAVLEPSAEVGDCCEAERLKSASNLGVIVGRSKSTLRSTSASWCNNNNHASNQAKMTVCRFYQQGYCRFGSMKVAFSCPHLPSNNHFATPMRSSSPSCLSHVASSCWPPAGFLDVIYSCPTRHRADCSLLEL